MTRFRWLLTKINGHSVFNMKRGANLEGTSSHSESSDRSMDNGAELPPGPPASLDDSDQATAATSD